MSKHLLVFVMIAAATAACAEPEVIHERIEWSDAWVTNADSDSLPRVLLIGDSIVRGYYAGVEKLLGDSVNLARYTTSKFAGDPDFLPELALLVRRYDFDVIHVNNGLHGFGYTEEQYGQAIQSLMDFLSREAPHAHVIWASSTPIRDSADLGKLAAEKNDRVVARNHIAAEIMAARNVTVTDLYSAVVERPELFSADGVHFNQEGQTLEAEMVAAALQSTLKPPSE